MLSYTLLGFFALVVFIHLVMHWYKRPSKKSTIPGIDPVDSRKGNLSDIAAAGSVHQFLVQLHKRYGPIASFWYGPRFTVSIASPELFKEHMGAYDRPPELFSQFEPLFGKHSITYANKDDARARRSIYDHSFGHETLQYFYGTFNECGLDLVKTLSALPSGQHVPLVAHCLPLAIKALMETSFGVYFHDDAKIHEFCQHYHVCWDEMEARLFKGPPKEGSDRERKFKAALDTMHSVVRGVLTQRRQSPTVGRPVFIDVLTENDLPEAQILDDCISFMVDGFHASGYLLAWTLYFLATHKECQEKVHREVDEVVGSSDLDNSHLGDLRYLRQVIDESHRVSLVSTYAARYQDKVSMLGGHVIPKRTPVIHALGVAYQDETIWPKPKKFDPERFDKKTLTQRQRAAFKPFGFAGKRICPGRLFSYAEVTVLIAILCRAFKFNLVPGQVVEPNHGLVTSPKEEIWVTLEKRNQCRL